MLPTCNSFRQQKSFLFLPMELLCGGVWTVLENVLIRVVNTKVQCKHRNLIYFINMASGVVVIQQRLVPCSIYIQIKFDVLLSLMTCILYCLHSRGDLSFDPIFHPVLLSSSYSGAVTLQRSGIQTIRHCFAIHYLSTKCSNSGYSGTIQPY